VVVAHQRTLNRAIALKVYRRLGPEEDRRNKRVQALAEVRSIAAVKHPNVAVLHDAYLKRGHMVALMELVEAPTLQAWSAQLKAEEVGRTAEELDWLTDRRGALLQAICDGLEAAYRVGVLHGDLHHNNVLVVRPAAEMYPHSQESPKIIDFGTSLFRDSGNHGKDLDYLDMKNLWIMGRKLWPPYRQRQELLDVSVSRLNALVHCRAVRLLVELDRVLQNASRAFANEELGRIYMRETYSGLEIGVKTHLQSALHLLRTEPVLNFDLVLQEVRHCINLDAERYLVHEYVHAGAGAGLEATRSTALSAYLSDEVVPVFVELEVAVPRLMPASR
jgi:serine/threonine protein kinase